MLDLLIWFVECWEERVLEWKEKWSLEGGFSLRPHFCMVAVPDWNWTLNKGKGIAYVDTIIPSTLWLVYIEYNKIHWDRLSFGLAASKMKEKARVVAMDLRGHGKSSTEDEIDLSIEVCMFGFTRTKRMCATTDVHNLDPRLSSSFSWEFFLYPFPFAYPALA